MSMAAGISQGTRLEDSRDAGLDIARGIAMILVVFGHALDGAQSAGHSTYPLRFWMISVYAVHVPLFFQVSGILAHATSVKPWQEFFVDIWGKIVWPYLLWSLILLSVLYVMRDHTNVPLQSFQPLSVLWRAPAVLWFLYVMCIALILFRVLAPLPQYVTFFVGTICLLAPYLSADLPQKIRFIGMFLIAAMAGPGALRAALKPWVILVATAVMILTLWLAADLAGDPIGGYPATEAIFIPAVFAGPILIYALSQGIAQLWSKGLLQSIGRNTMAIFVTHILVTAGMRIVLIKLGVTNWGVIILMATTTGVLLPLAAARLAGYWGLSRHLGWR